MLKVYGFSRVNEGARGNTRDLRVLWTLEEMGMPYEIVGMDHPNHELDSREFKAKNPFGQIPIVDDEGVIVSESGAILLYLARKSGMLMPRDLAGEAQVLRWTVAALSTIEMPILALWFVNSSGGKGTGPSEALYGWSDIASRTARRLACESAVRGNRRVHGRRHPDDARSQRWHGPEPPEAVLEHSRL